MEKLVLHSDKRFLPPNVKHSEILYPFWGLSPEPEEMDDAHRFDCYTNTGNTIFEYSNDIDSADFVVLPTDWKRYVRTNSVDLALRFNKLVESLQKKLLVFYLSDSDEPIPELKNAIILRSSLNKTTKTTNEYALPAWSYDYVTEKLSGCMPLREKALKPVIGFCGNAVPRKKSIMKSILHFMVKRFHLPFPIREHYLDLRARALAVFQSSADVSTNFLLRDAYYGGAIQHGKWNLQILRARRTEYFANMLSSDYVICMRGSGNFSFRFYETLSSGRIPVFINTDCELPYSAFIDYQKSCVWIEAGNLGNAIQELLAFHRQLTDAEFKALQLTNRSLWLDWLSPQGYFSHLYLIKKGLWEG